jgi:hypothetical protein
LRKSQDRGKHSLHNLPAAEDDEEVSSDGGDDGLLGGEGASIADPGSKLDGRGRKVETGPGLCDQRVDGTGTRSPSGEGGHFCEVG